MAVGKLVRSQHTIAVGRKSGRVNGVQSPGGSRSDDAAASITAAQESSPFLPLLEHLQGSPEEGNDCSSQPAALGDGLVCRRRQLLSRRQRVRMLQEGRYQELRLPW